MLSLSALCVFQRAQIGKGATCEDRIRSQGCKASAVAAVLPVAVAAFKGGGSRCCDMKQARWWSQERCRDTQQEAGATLLAHRYDVALLKPRNVRMAAVR